MDADAQVAPIAALVADGTRATILWALSDGRALPACDLALEAGVTAATISYQLEKLVAGGLVAAERQGRHRYYRLAGPTVVSLLEVLAAVAPPVPARTFREGQKGKALRFARSCYDHLAGRLGVQVAEALVARACLAPAGRDYELTPAGERLFAGLAVDVAGARSARRCFARACLDWSERRHHLAGALGAALLDRLLEFEWIERTRSSRALRLSEAGRRGLREHFQVEV
ncbi:MAG TPA: metalloregulator ArsR/SmtB family transcription factor [Thermoanaerobaculia bacterium]|nr:metalloregulator ArsR/SmtB family transcription factor [Thermoanaerobaculia bacterium]